MKNQVRHSLLSQRFQACAAQQDKRREEICVKFVFQVFVYTSVTGRVRTMTMKGVHIFVPEPVEVLPYAATGRRAYIGDLEVETLSWTFWVGSP